MILLSICLLYFEWGTGEIIVSEVEVIFRVCPTFPEKTLLSKLIGVPDVIHVFCVNLLIFSLQQISFNKCFHLRIDF